jgi:hypothetical protein
MAAASVLESGICVPAATASSVSERRLGGRYYWCHHLVCVTVVFPIAIVVWPLMWVTTHVATTSGLMAAAAAQWPLLKGHRRVRDRRAR